MHESLRNDGKIDSPRHDLNAAASVGRYSGPDRRRHAPKARNWLKATLDEMDYGVLLVDAQSRLIHINHAAASELDASHPLHVRGGEVAARRPQDNLSLHDALRSASQRRLRKLLTLGDESRRVGISVVPLSTGEDEPQEPVTLLLLGKERVCEVLSVQGFAIAHGLTSAETRVLTELCNGTPPARIAQMIGVKISTVRTQISTIRVKTGAESIRDLVRQIARLPPLRGVLRTASSIAFSAMHSEPPVAAPQPSSGQFAGTRAADRDTLD